MKFLKKYYYIRPILQRYGVTHLCKDFFHCYLVHHERIGFRDAIRWQRNTIVQDLIEGVVSPTEY